ncbi:MAG: flagellar filament capping protein FliD, partial [Lysinibacillus sp.]
KLLQNKQKYEWQRDAYREVNTKLKAFDDYLFSDMTLQKDFYKKSIVSTNSAVSAVPTTADTGQTITVDSVDKLARAGNAKGQLDPGTSGSSTLSSLGILAANESKSVSMKVLQTDGTMKDVNLTFNDTDTIDSVISKLKNNTGLNAYYDSKSGQIALSTKTTGKAEAYEVTRMFEDENGMPVEGKGTSDASVYISEGSDFFEGLGFTAGEEIISNGQNAEITINGVKIERQSNTFEIEGMKLTLNNTYSSVNGQPIDLTTKVDADNMVDKIKKFVETYNGLIDSMNALTKEPKYRDYAPLTDEQKKDMDQKEIEAWEKKAKSGLLRNDNILNNALNTLRTTMYSKGGGKQDVKASDGQPSQNFINTLYEMGITTTDKMTDRGKLKIDENKLREAIEKDPEQVFKTFSDTTVGNEGIVQKLRKNVQSTMLNIEKKAGKADATNQSFQIGRSIRDTENRIDLWKNKLADIEQRYWKQFTAMETAINKGNQQSSIFMQGQ